MSKVAFILSGSGHRDGTEIHEATCALLALDRAGVDVVGFAPDRVQTKVINHLNQKEMNEKRDMSVEAGRIMRGNVKPLSELKTDDFDGLVMPGGYGAALNFTNYDTAGAKCEIDKDLQKKILGFIEAKKPIAAICISPLIIARALKNSEISPALTIGNNSKVASDIEAMGAVHKACAADDIVVDDKNQIVSTPAYMLAIRISQVDTGIRKLIATFIEFMNRSS